MASSFINDNTMYTKFRNFKPLKRHYSSLPTKSDLSKVALGYFGTACIVGLSSIGLEMAVEMYDTKSYSIVPGIEFMMINVATGLLRGLFWPAFTLVFGYNLLSFTGQQYVPIGKRIRQRFCPYDF